MEARNKGLNDWRSSEHPQPQSTAFQWLTNGISRVTPVVVQRISQIFFGGSVGNFQCGSSEKEVTINCFVISVSLKRANVTAPVGINALGGINQPLLQLHKTAAQLLISVPTLVAQPA
jgi:hypothetical protein